MRRIAYDGQLVPTSGGYRDVALDGRAAHYVTRVLRLRAGVETEISDTLGQLARGTLVWREGNPWVEGLRTVAVHTGPARVLVAALIKQRRWEWMLEKATELGATALYPYAADHSVVQVPANKVTDRVGRWQRMVDEASKQCRRTGRLTVHPPIGRSELGSVVQGVPLFFDTETPNAPWPRAGEDVTLFVGPEGGWTTEERATILGLGAHAVGLGDRVLRAETAALAALAHLALLTEVGGE